MHECAVLQLADLTPRARTYHSPHMPQSLRSAGWRQAHTPCEMNCGRCAACVASTFSALEGSVTSSRPAGGRTACGAGSASVPDVRHAVSHEVPTQGMPLERPIAHFLLLGLSDMRCVTKLHCAAVTLSMHLHHECISDDGPGWGACARLAGL